MFGSLNTSSTTTTKKGNEFKSKKYFKDNKLSGLYQDFDPYTGKLKEQGRFENGMEVGRWKVIDNDGDEIHYSYTMQRVGAICGDGTRSSATGRGACSWHGGVAEWLYDSVKSKVGGTGKYMPIEDRVEALKKEVRAKFKITKQGLEFQEAIYNMLLDLADQKEELSTQVAEFEELLLNQAQDKKILQDQLDCLKQAYSKNDSTTNSKVISKDLSKEYAKPQGKPQEGQDASNGSEEYSQEEVTQAQPQKKGNPQLNSKQNPSKQDNKPTQKQQLFEKAKPKQQTSQTKKKEPKVVKKAKKEESENNDSWQSDFESEEDQHEKGQRALIEELFQKMNLK